MAKIKRTTPPLRLTMFHFLCPLCGAKPGERPLRSYLNEWASSPPERVAGLIVSVDAALANFLKGELRWVRTSFLKAAKQLRSTLDQARTVLANSGFSTSEEVESCVVCDQLLGERMADRYFDDWGKACRVQTANLLYEINLIVWHVVREVPPWCDAPVLAELDSVRRTLRSTAKKMNALECPVCRRTTAHLYGTSHQFCRWCLEMSGGFKVGFSITEDGTFQTEEPDPTLAVIEDADLLPPD